MTGDLSKFAPSLSQKYGIDLNVAQGGLPTVGKTEEVGGIKVDELPEAIKNLIKARDQLAADVQEMKDNPLVPQLVYSYKWQQTKDRGSQARRLQTRAKSEASTSVIDTADKISQRSTDVALEILRQNFELLGMILENRKDERKSRWRRKRKVL